MWAIIGLLMIGGVISLFEILPLIKQKNWREVTVFFILLSIGLLLNILLVLRIEIPTPLDLLNQLYKPFTF